MSDLEFAKRAKEIGSYFDISPNDMNNAKFDGEFKPFEGALYLSTCRSAIDIILKKIVSVNKVALLPGFTCHAVVEPFINNGFQVIPYNITRNLEIDQDDLIRKAEEYHPDIVLIHDYFGFDSNKNLRESGILKKIREVGSAIINDQTQSMFSSYMNLEGNYQICSIRKWMGIPDGAFLIGFSENEEYVSDTELEKAKIEAMTYKHGYLFDEIGNKDIVLMNYKKAESILDSREIPYSISNISKALFCHYDISNIKKVRQQNGRILLNAVIENSYISCPFDFVSDNEVPFQIPFLIKKKRKEFQSYLAQNNVFATVIWGCSEEFADKISEETRQIYDEILCIPCDQRYSVVDMKYICELISAFKW